MIMYGISCRAWVGETKSGRNGVLFAGGAAGCLLASATHHHLPRDQHLVIMQSNQSDAHSSQKRWPLPIEWADGGLVHRMEPLVMV